MSKIKVFSAPTPNAPVTFGNYASGTSAGSPDTVYADQVELDTVNQSLSSATDAILDNTNKINELSSSIGNENDFVTELNLSK